MNKIKAGLKIHENGEPPSPIQPQPMLKTQIVNQILDLIKKNKIGIVPDVLITPNVAHDLLTLNINNRKYSQRTVDKFAYIMKEDNWIPNGDTIGIDCKGVLFDGQQRLMAIHQSGKAQIYPIFYGAPEEAYATKDSGKKRTPADIYSKMGYENSVQLAAACKLEWLYRKTGRVIDMDTTGENRMINLDYERWPEEGGNMKRMSKYVNMGIEYNKKKKFLTAGQYGFVLYMLADLPNRVMDAEEFMEKLISGRDISEVRNSQIFCLRENFLDLTDKTNKKSVGFTFKLKQLIKAWNFYITKTPIKELKLSKNEWSILEIEKPAR